MNSWVSTNYTTLPPYGEVASHGLNWALVETINSV